MKEKKIKILFFIIINLILPIIFCIDDCSVCGDASSTCPPNCKKSSINGDSNYYYCNFDGSNQYYVIDDQCYVKPNCNNFGKIVYGTNECVNSCGSNLYELGDFCFKENEYSENAELISTSSKILKCKDKYYITEESGKKKYICLEVEQECPNTYTSYEFDTGLCFIGSCDSLGEDKRIKSESRNSGTTINRCSIECKESEYLKTRIESSKIVYTCIDICSTFENDDTTIKRCYANKEECIADGYKYIKGNLCLKECPGFKVKYTVDSQNRIISLGICYDDLISCINNGYQYYNIEERECWVSCPGFINFDINTKLPIRNDDFVSNCVTSCTGSYPRISGNYCKAKCIGDEYYDQSYLNQCKSDCGSKYIKINNNDEKICVEFTDCPDNKFFINGSGKRQCMPEGGCQGEYKYLIDGEDQCYKKCPKKADGKYYFYDENNKCISSCIGTGKEFAEDPTYEPKQCLEDSSDKSYYEEDKILRENCELYKEQSSKVCVKQCQEGYKVYDNYCIEQCPPGKPNFVETTMSILGENKNIKKCFRL